MQFMFTDKEEAIDMCTEYARAMPQFDASNIDQLVRAPFVADEFDVEKTKAFAAELCKVDALNVYLRSKSFEGKTDQTDEWFKT